MNGNQRVLCCLAILVSAGSARAGSSIDESRAMSPDGLVQVENLAGSIEITGWDRAEAHVSGELGDDVEKLEITESSSGIEIRVRNRKNLRQVDESHLRLQLPATASVEAESVSADISLTGMQSPSLVLNTVSADLIIESSAARLEAESVSGDVTFRGRTPRAAVETVSGDIDLQGMEGEVRISTVSGDVKLDAEHIGRGQFETVSGNLKLQLDVIDGGRLNAESMSGDVHLVLPAGQQAEYTAQSYSGEIRSDFGSVKGESYGGGSSLSFREANNGATIRVESFSGDIDISGD